MRPPLTTSSQDEKRQILQEYEILQILQEYEIASVEELTECVFCQKLKYFQRILRGSDIPHSHHDGIISETMVVLVEGIHTVRYKHAENPVITCSKWLNGVFNNKMRDRKRTLAKEGRLMEQAVPAMEAMHRQSDFPEAIWEILKTAFESLKPKHQELILKHHLEGRSYEELQEEFGGTVNQLKSCCYYARQRLREEMIKLADD